MINKQLNLKSSWLIIAIFPILALAIAGALFVGLTIKNKQQQITQIDNTINSDWKTYSNSDLGFSINIPKDLSKPKLSYSSDGIVVNFNNQLIISNINNLPEAEDKIKTIISNPKSLSEKLYIYYSNNPEALELIEKMLSTINFNIENIVSPTEDQNSSNGGITPIQPLPTTSNPTATLTPTPTRRPSPTPLPIATSTPPPTPDPKNLYKEGCIYGCVREEKFD